METGDVWVKFPVVGREYVAGVGSELRDEFVDDADEVAKGLEERKFYDSATVVDAENEMWREAIDGGSVRPRPEGEVRRRCVWED